MQLYNARQTIRPGKEQEAENRAQEVYSKKYSPCLMFYSKKVVSRMLGEETKRRTVRRMMWQAQKNQSMFQKKTNGQEQQPFLSTKLTL